VKDDQGKSRMSSFPDNFSATIDLAYAVVMTDVYRQTPVHRPMQHS